MCAGLVPAARNRTFSRAPESYAAVRLTRPKQLRQKVYSVSAMAAHTVSELRDAASTISFHADASVDGQDCTQNGPRHVS